MLDLACRASGREFNMAVPLVDRHVDEGRGNRPALRLEHRDVAYAELLPPRRAVIHALRKSRRR